MTRPRAEQPARTRPQVRHWLWLGPLLYMAVVGLYFVGRNQGRWAETDSATFANVTRVFADHGRLVPQEGEIYPNGYGYQAISTFIVSLTGLNVAVLQQIVYPLVAALIVLPAWLLYRELTESARGATLATILLFTQPEFLFVILRSTHEKFTRTLLLLCLFWVVRSFKLRDRPWLFATHIALFYLSAYAFITTNNLMAHSFIFAVATALLLGWGLEKRRAHLQQVGYIIRRLAYTMLICLGLAYVFTFYAYPPAQHDVVIMKSLWDRIAALLLDLQAQRPNPYAPIGTGWVSLPVYFLLSIANWILLVTSFVLWARQGLRWLWRGEAPPTQTGLLLWLFYAAFAAQGALSIAADAGGALASNLQHRLFSSFSLIAVGVVGAALAQWRPKRGQFGLTVGIACIAILSVLKATNEPLLSNKWIFYRREELMVLEWSDVHLWKAEIATEFDERLYVAYLTDHGESTNFLVYYQLRPATRNFLITTITRLRSSRLGRPLPVPPDALRVYDNGIGELYHLRPETPYQP